MLCWWQCGQIITTGLSSTLKFWFMITNAERNRNNRNGFKVNHRLYSNANYFAVVVDSFEAGLLVGGQAAPSLTAGNGLCLDSIRCLDALDDVWEPVGRQALKALKAVAQQTLHCTMVDGLKQYIYVKTSA